MGYSPAGLQFPVGPTIHPMSTASIGLSIRAFNISLGTSTAYPLANVALFVPFSIDDTVTFQSVFWQTGSVTGGNCDVGVYDEAGTRLFSSGTTARGTASSIITTGITPYTLSRGRYYLAFSHDGTNNMLAGAPAAGLCAATGVLERTSSFVLPADASSWVATTRAYIPNFGIYTGTIAL